MIFRVAVVEKRIALHYIRNGSIKIQNFEAPGYEVGEDGNEIIDEKESSKPTVKFSTKELFLSWYGMITTARSLTLLLITFING